MIQSSSNAMHTQPSRVSRLLRLPLELRDQIYDELLVLDRYCETPHGKLHTAILRVNKQIHYEAAKAFYQRNLWVLFTFNRSRHGPALPCWYNIQKIIFWVDIKDPRTCDVYFGARAPVRVDVRTPDREPEAQKACIAPMFAAESIFRWYNYELAKKRTLNFEIRVADSAHLHINSQQTLLEYIRDLRGVRKANVQGLKPESINKETSLLMETPVTIDEAVCRGRTYQQRAEQTLASGSISRSASIYHHGMVYMHDVAKFIKNYHEADASKLSMMADKRWEISLGFAISAVKNKNFEEGIRFLNRALKDTAGRPDREKVDILYYKGVAYKAMGQYVRAAIAFSKALDLRPEWTEAEQEFNTLEEMADQPTFTENGDVNWELWDLRVELKYIRPKAGDATKAKLTSG